MLLRIPPTPSLNDSQGPPGGTGPKLRAVWTGVSTRIFLTVQRSAAPVQRFSRGRARPHCRQREPSGLIRLQSVRSRTSVVAYWIQTVCFCKNQQQIKVIVLLTDAAHISALGLSDAGFLAPEQVIFSNNCPVR